MGGRSWEMMCINGGGEVPCSIAVTVYNTFLVEVPIYLACGIGRLTSFFAIWELEASRCVQKDVRGCANIFHYRKPHFENFTFSRIFE